MGEVQSWVVPISAKTAGALVGGGVGSLIVLAGLATSNPLLVIGGPALAAAATERMTEFAVKQWTDRAERVERFGTTAAEQSGTSLETLLDDAVADPQKLEVLSRAAEAASRALDQEKIDLLARVYASGVYDQALIDESNILIDNIRQIEGPHIRVMQVLASPGPRTLKIGEKDAGQTIEAWPEPELAVAAKAGDALSALIAKLVSLGFVYDEGQGRWDYQPFWQLTPLGRNCLTYLAQRVPSDHDGVGSAS
ncbi:hypothetical protein [Actinoplanes teichomyceticus]|uniref:Uncharacterized protein n=1 Tax=Actinoplanes teichomyceticus TaxID=1867 RepID=A0A561WS97_ACTTI|nr:hypothetical protein [Actinoplanes teichomyceticus]TWG26741.1 hypothetical protein FHX34_1011739 [Actinoplanes teichomyceticus]GIF15140.1 hypothetical protein Ate01nite_51720 [Actinoplanes teichomyceticus]